MQIESVTSRPSAPRDISSVRARAAAHAPRDSLVEAGPQLLTRLQGQGLSTSSADSLETALAALLRSQAQQTTGTVRESESRIAQQLRVLKEQHEKQIEATKRRQAAQKRSHGWARFLRIFKIVATVLSAAGSICTGGTLGIIAGALLVASAVVADRVKGAVGQWLSLGLSLASGIGGAVVAGLRAGSKLLGDGVLKALHVTRLAAGVGEAGGTVAQARAEHDALKAQADLAELSTDRARVENELAASKAETATALEERARASEAVLDVLQRSSHVAQLAV